MDSGSCGSRRAEDILPDHEALPGGVSDAGESACATDKWRKLGRLEVEHGEPEQRLGVERPNAEGSLDPHVAGSIERADDERKLSGRYALKPGLALTTLLQDHEILHEAQPGSALDPGIDRPREAVKQKAYEQEQVVRVAGGLGTFELEEVTRLGGKLHAAMRSLARRRGE
jgi:hypothetical protein